MLAGLDCEEAMLDWDEMLGVRRFSNLSNSGSSSASVEAGSAADSRTVTIESVGRGPLSGCVHGD